MLDVTPELFTDLVAFAVGELGGAGARPSPSKNLALILGDRAIPLHEAYADYRRTTDAGRPAALQRAALALVGATLPRSLEDARPHLVPRVRPRAELGLAELKAALRPIRGLTIEATILADHLALTYALELDGRRLTVTRPLLDAWGASSRELRDLARANYAARNPDDLATAPHVELRRSRWADEDHVTRLAQLGLFRGLPLRGAPVAACPGTQSLLVAGADDDPAIAALLADAERPAGAPLPAYVIVLGPRWTAWRPTTSAHKNRVLMRNLTVAAEEYAAQARALLAWQPADELPRLVAPELGIEPSTGAPYSVATWDLGRPLLLPRTERIRFVDGDRPLVTTPWARAQAVLGERLRALPGYPERWFASGFPTAPELAELTAA